MTRVNQTNVGGSIIGRIRSSYRARPLVVSALLVLGVAVTAATVSVVAVGALNILSDPSAPTSSPAANTVRWVVPHDQTGAPFVPSSGGAAGGVGSFNGVSCPSASECVAVGGDANLGGVASTSLNGGSTWSQGKLDAHEPELNAVDCVSTSTCVAVGQGATVRSTNGGKTWTSSAVPTNDTTLLGVTCPNATDCVSVGVSPSVSGPFAGQLLLSSNGGTTWTVPTLPASFGALGSVDCPTSSFCVAVGSSVIVSNDAGKTWTQRTVAGGSGVLRSVSCLSATTCIAIGANPAVAQDPIAAAYEDVTSDGGATWSSLTMPQGSATLDVISCSNFGCDAAGSAFNGAPAIVYTTSSGVAWTANSSLAGSATAISSVSCSSAATCVFAGQNGKSPITVSSLNGVATIATPVSAQVRTQKDVQR